MKKILSVATTISTLLSIIPANAWIYVSATKTSTDKKMTQNHYICIRLQMKI